MAQYNHLGIILNAPLSQPGVTWTGDYSFRAATNICAPSPYNYQITQNNYSDSNRNGVWDTGDAFTGTSTVNCPATYPN